jgi:hypothetical protein
MPAGTNRTHGHIHEKNKITISISGQVHHIHMDCPVPHYFFCFFFVFFRTTRHCSRVSTTHSHTHSHTLVTEHSGVVGPFMGVQVWERRGAECHSRVGHSAPQATHYHQGSSSRSRHHREEHYIHCCLVGVMAVLIV